MAEKVNLRIMRCPTCGASLKAENGSDVITCVYCGNSIVPVVQQDAAPGGFNGVLKVEGIKTSSSTLAYMEQFFEEYDWEAFAYAQTLSVAEIDALAGPLRVSSADDKNTWIVCFKAIAVPFAHKVAGCRQILASVIEEYRNDDLDAYSKFDAYKRISAMIGARKDGIVTELEKIAAKAARYGASDAEVGSLRADIDSIRALDPVTVYGDIEAIPQIRAFIEEKNARIVKALAARGIDAEAAYARAKDLIAEQKYVDALNILLPLKGYSDTSALIEKIDKYFLISDALEIGGKLYLYKEGTPGSGILCLYPVVDGKISNKAIIGNIRKIITNHADTLYFIDSNGCLRRYDLSTGTGDTVSKKTFRKTPIHIYGRKAYLPAFRGADPSSKRYDIVELDLISGSVTTVLENVRDIAYSVGSKLACTVAVKKGTDPYNVRYDTVARVIDLDTMATVDLGTGKITVEGFIGDLIVYTKPAPNDDNKDLYIKSFAPEASEKLIEKNIFTFCDIIAGKLFYYIGNSNKRTLINICPDGTGRKEWPLYISKVLLEQGGWLYFIRKAGYNSILCRSRLDGSSFHIIAADIEEFIAIKNGYLYYINGDQVLVKVRMDGSNLQKLCEDVESVLSVKEDKIIFVSVDARIRVGIPPQTSWSTVKSIYAVDFSGNGKSKLAYNIEFAKEYDENTVYYTVLQKTETSYEQPQKQRMLYRLDVHNDRTEHLLTFTVPEEEKKGGCYVATCVYGSYDCPQVWTLRRFRDDTLAATWYGRAFIRAYYAVSPTIVKWFGDTRWFKGLWKGGLDKLVSYLRSNGVEDTPYKDKNWR